MFIFTLNLIKKDTEKKIMVIGKLSFLWSSVDIS
jgi:hypothetical protein